MINQVVFRGNLTRDPELKHIQSGTAVVNFALANNRRYQKKGSEEWLDDTTFVECEAWDATAERIAEKFAKGECMLVTGQLKEDRWEDAEGQKRSRLKLRILSYEAAAYPKKADVDSEAGDEAEKPAPKSKAAPKGKTDAKAAKKPAPPQADDDEDVPF